MPTRVTRCAGRTGDEGYLGTEEFAERGQRGGEPTDQNIDCRLGGRAEHSILLDRVAERSRLLGSGRRSPRRIAKERAVSQVIEGTWHQTPPLPLGTSELSVLGAGVAWSRFYALDGDLPLQRLVQRFGLGSVYVESACQWP